MLVAEAVVEAVLGVSEMIKDKIPERPLVTEWLAALDSTGNDCTLARYVLYLEGELVRLRAEVKRLREVERLAKKYATISSNRGRLLGVGQDFRNHDSVCAKAFREREYLHQTEIAARNALFTALGKEAAE